MSFLPVHSLGMEILQCVVLWSKVLDQFTSFVKVRKVGCTGEGLG